jgi:hypothetical protein
MLNSRGVILSAPKYILLYKLSGLQYLTTAKLETAYEIISFQAWLSETYQDVLDESDVSLAIKT